MKPAHYSVQVNGRVQFPRICPHCGAFADQTVPISHTFSRKYTTRSKSGRKTTHTYYDTETFRVPFCADCIALHQAEVVPPTWGNYGYQALSMVQYAIFAGMVIFFLSIMWRDLLQEETIALSFILGSAIFVLLGVLLPLYLSIRRSRHHVISAPTRISRAVSFGDKVRGKLWERPSRTFHFSHAVYTQQFVAENGERVLSSSPFAAVTSAKV